MTDRQRVLVEFSIPSGWDEREFLAVLMGCYDDGEGRDNAEAVACRIVEPVK